MLKEKLIRDLKKFGLSEYEAKAYLALTVYGSLTASLISQRSKIPQSKVYEVMKSLISKSLAEIWNTKPQKFKAVEPVHALKKIIEQKKDFIQDLKNKSSLIVNELKPYNKTKDYGLWSSKGKRAFLEKAAEMIARAKKFGFATTSRFSRYPILDDAYKNALKKGIDIKMLGTSDLDAARRARASWYVKQGAQVRILPMDIHSILGVVDDKEVCVRIDNPIEPDFIWSNNPAMINIFKTYFEELWERGRVFKV